MMLSKPACWVLIFAVGVVFFAGCVKVQKVEEASTQPSEQGVEKNITQQAQSPQQVNQELLEKYNSYRKLIYEKAERLREFEEQPQGEQAGGNPAPGLPPQQAGYPPEVLEFRNLLSEFKQFILDNEAALRDAGVDTDGDIRFIEEQLALEKKQQGEEEVVLSLPFERQNYYKANVGLWPFCVHGGEHPEGHGGIDFELKQDTLVRAAAEGVVEEIFSGEKGYNVFIRHGRIVTGYIPVLELKVKKGDTVKRGQVIGKAGHDSKGKYFIHFEVNDFTKGGRVCPYGFFDNETKKLVDEWLREATYPEKTREPYLCNCEGPIPPA